MTDKLTPPTQLVWIKWFDASYQLGECVEEDLNSRVEMESGGIFIREDEHTVSMAMDHHKEQKTWRHISHIPKVNIIEMRRFDVAEEKEEVPEEEELPAAAVRLLEIANELDGDSVFKERLAAQLRTIAHSKT